MSLAAVTGSVIGVGPTTGFVSYDERFAAVLGPDPRLVQACETDAHEGPVYVAAEDALYFTTLPRPGQIPAAGFPEVVIKRLALDGGRFPLEPARLSIVRAVTGVANGMTFDPPGGLLVCEQGTRSEHAAIRRLELATGAFDVVIDQWRGLRFNSPNDIVVKTDGTIWFTDPSYGHLQGFKNEPLIGDYVYRHDPATGRTTAVADTFDKPNGLAFSPDERTLYIADSGANQEPSSYYPSRPHHIVAYEVRDDRHLAGERLFAVVTPGSPDGLKVDAAGRVYASSYSGVQVFEPDGDLVGEIRLPGTVNFAFGGPDRSVLFITTDTAVWAAALNTSGPSTAGRSPQLKGV
jgi:gluconolactonase